MMRAGPVAVHSRRDRAAVVKVRQKEKDELLGMASSLKPDIVAPPPANK